MQEANTLTIYQQLQTETSFCYDIASNLTSTDFELLPNCDVNSRSLDHQKLFSYWPTNLHVPVPYA